MYYDFRAMETKLEFKLAHRDKYNKAELMEEIMRALHRLFVEDEIKPPFEVCIRGNQTHEQETQEGDSEQSV